jgi:Holliday junction resolvase RusA-like endonuclease
MTITLLLPRPPSTNNLYATVGRHRVPSVHYIKWREDAGWEAKLQAKGQTITGPFELTIWLPPGIDLDNVKCVPDLLGPVGPRRRHSLGITEDDSKMVALHVYRDASATKCRVQIAPMAQVLERLARHVEFCGAPGYDMPLPEGDAHEED